MLATLKGAAGYMPQNSRPTGLGKVTRVEDEIANELEDNGLASVFVTDPAASSYLVQSKLGVGR
jgi:hypothetical protein